MLGLVLVLPVLAIVVLTVHDVVRRPVLRRLAFRNAYRRKSESLLVLVGSLLATAIITASFLVGDTLGASIRESARTQLGPADEAVRVSQLDRLDQVARALATPLPATDGTLPVITSEATALAPGPRPRAEPRAALLEVDFDAARQFGGDMAATGMAKAGPTPAGDEAVIGVDLARRLHLRSGQHVEVYAYGTHRSFRIRQIVPRLGIAGFDVADSSRSPNLFVAPGTIASMVAGGSPGTAAPPAGLVLVSNEGGVFDGADATPEVKKALEGRVAGIPGVKVETLKQDLLDDAETSARSITRLFGGIGAFSVIAGVLLLVNIFVMLAEERKSELGMLRAVGLRRNQLVRAFGIEGALQAVVAAVIGAGAGIGVGRVIVVVAQRILEQGDDEFHVTVRFTAKPSSVLLGAALGAVISLVTVWAASIRIGRLNVIRAIRDLPEQRLHRRHLGTFLLGALGIVVGGALLAVGASQDEWFPALAGVPLAAFSAIPLLGRVVSRRLAVTIGCAIALVWGVTAFSLLPDALGDADIPTFVVQGVILVGAAVAIVSVNDDAFLLVAERLSVSGRALAARLGLAYPLAKRFRTSMLLGMYALVVFTLTFLSVFSKLFADQGPRFTSELRSGYDLIVDANPGNPLPTEELQRQPEVAAAAPLLRVFPEFSASRYPEPQQWPLTGFDARLLERGQPALSARLDRFPDDRSAWLGALRDPTLVMVPDFFLQEGGGRPTNPLRPGDPLVVYDRGAGRRAQLTVAGIVSADFVFNGAMVDASFVKRFFGPQAVLARHYVQVRPGLDPERVAADLTGRLVRQGTDARTIHSIVRSGLQQNEGFFRLMQGYLALGLVIGIAGLGVVMVRAVRERRRSIAMLRAMGFSHRVVRSAFLLEAAFVAIQGIVLGVSLALIVSYQLLTNSTTFAGQRLGFGVPWLSLAVVLVATLGGSIVASLAPATNASRIKPAVALRIAD